MPTPDPDLLRRLDRYLDEVPRSSADVVDAGPMRAFVSRARWPYYARPRAELDLHAAGSVGGPDLTGACDVLREAALPVAFEWVAELVPSMADAAADAGLDITLYPLLVLAEPLPVDLPPDVTVRFLADDDPAIPAANVVADLGFAAAGTAAGMVGTVQRDHALASYDPAATADTGERIRAGLTRRAVAVHETDGVVGSGSHQPVHDVTEIVGVAVLPAYRRRGIAAALTAALTRDAMAGGADVVMLSAGSDDVARVYERVGFVRVGHAGEASAGD